ncbi:hypothetical protein NHX12_005147 [Muraenolepis orangiensis]|uniref:PLAC domain-containing protein n=1 Tax=Muraenolepis orangiensis TaxID=630683 RepID=A0A9Q0DR03_9TELE|nr:hypothetical protein NHX12_005147 [Muraenolepis orangiensis]
MGSWSARGLLSAPGLLVSPGAPGQPRGSCWSAGDWGPCSLTCGGGQQTRALRCLRKVTYQREEVAAHALCPVAPPAQLQPCHTQACPPQWSTGSWSQCSKTCGRGLRKRSVFCRSMDPGPRVVPGVEAAAAAVVPDSMCRQHHRPKAQETCVLRRCPRNDRLQWIPGPWGECSKSCGPGLQKRELGCGERGPQGGHVEFPSRRCRNLARPRGLDLQRWQQCSVSCGGGVQTRSTQCLLQGRPAGGCLAHQRPSSSRACNTHFCPAPGLLLRPGLVQAQGLLPRVGSLLRDEQCTDHFSWCHLVPQHGVCHHKFYGQQCCKSCGTRQ